MIGVFDWFNAGPKWMRESVGRAVRTGDFDRSVYKTEPSVCSARDMFEAASDAAGE